MSALLCWIEAHPGTASWAQAVGAFLAIVAAFLLASLQGTAALRLRKEERSDKVRSILALVRSVHRSLAAMHEKLLAEPPKQYVRFLDPRLRENAKVACDGVLAIRLDALPTENTVACVIAAQASVRSHYIVLEPTRNQIDEAGLKVIKNFVDEVGALCQRLEDDSTRTGK